MKFQLNIFGNLDYFFTITKLSKYQKKHIIFTSTTPTQENTPPNPGQSYLPTRYSKLFFIQYVFWGYSSPLIETRLFLRFRSYRVYQGFNWF